MPALGAEERRQPSNANRQSALEKHNKARLQFSCVRRRWKKVWDFFFFCSQGKTWRSFPIWPRDEEFKIEMLELQKRR